MPPIRKGNVGTLIPSSSVCTKPRAALVSQSVDAVFGGENTIPGFEADIRALASAGAERDPMAEEQPTFSEQGVGVASSSPV